MEMVSYKAPEKVDARNSKKVEQDLLALIEKGEQEIVFDMEGMKYISSAGLRVLLNAQKKLLPSGNIYITNVPPAVTEILDITGFSSMINTI